MKLQSNRVWSWPVYSRRRRDSVKENDDDIRRHRRKEGVWQNICCGCCSNSMLIGLLVVLLICIAGVVPAVTILLTSSGQTTYVASISSTNNPTSAIIITTSSSTSTSSTTSFVAISMTTSVSTTTQTMITTTIATTTTTTAPYCLTRITFDDIPNQLPTTGIVPNGYNNLNWSNTQYVNGSSMPPSGYQTAVSSSPFAAYNLGGSTIQISTANGTGFAFNSIILSAAWRDDLTWTISGYRAGVSLIAGGMTLFPMNKTILTCSVCSNWDTLYMSSSGGTPHPGLSQNTTEFVFDDLCISFGY